MPVEKVGNAVGHDGAGVSCGGIGWKRVGIAVDEFLVVGAHEADVDTGLGAGERLDGLACRLEGLIHDFHQQPLLGVDGRHFDGLDVEKVGIEVAVVLVEEVALGDVGCPVMVGIGVVEGIGVESILRNTGDKVPRLEEQVPEFGGARGGAWESEATAHHGDGFFAPVVGLVLNTHVEGGGEGLFAVLKPAIIQKNDYNNWEGWESGLKKLLAQGILVLHQGILVLHHIYVASLSGHLIILPAL